MQEKEKEKEIVNKKETKEKEKWGCERERKSEKVKEVVWERNGERRGRGGKEKIQSCFFLEAFMKNLRNTVLIICALLVELTL